MQTRYFTNELEAGTFERDLRAQGFATLLKWTRGYKRIQVKWCPVQIGDGQTALEISPLDTPTHRVR